MLQAQVASLGSREDDPAASLTDHVESLMSTMQRSGDEDAATAQAHTRVQTQWRRLVSARLTTLHLESRIADADRERERIEAALTHVADGTATISDPRDDEEPGGAP